MECLGTTQHGGGCVEWLAASYPSCWIVSYDTSRDGALLVLKTGVRLPGVLMIRRKKKVYQWPEGRLCYSTHSFYTEEDVGQRLTAEKRIIKKIAKFCRVLKSR